MRGRHPRWLSRLRTGNLRLQRERPQPREQPLSRKAHRVNKAFLSPSPPETVAAPETQHPRAGPGPLQTFLKRKRPCSAPAERSQKPRSSSAGEKATDPSLLRPPNTGSPHPTKHSTEEPPHLRARAREYRKSASPQMQGEFGEVQLRLRARATGAAAAPAQCPRTCDPRESSAAVSSTPPVPVQERSRPPGWEAQRAETPAVPSVPRPLRPRSWRAAPGLAPACRSPPKLPLPSPGRKTNSKELDALRPEHPPGGPEPSASFMRMEGGRARKHPQLGNSCGIAA